MKAIGHGLSHIGLKTDFQRGVVFFLLTTLIFGLLILADRDYWAGPWLIASMFTFGVWRLSRQRSK
jgi:hypothetical protein